MQSEGAAHTQIVVGSDRSFGIVFTVVFAIVGLYGLVTGTGVRFWALGISAVFLAFAVFLPSALRPLNLLWFRIGMLLARVINPIVMAVIYVVAMLPIAAMLRLAGKDLLRTRRDPTAESYWIPRDPPGPEPASLKDQF